MTIAYTQTSSDVKLGENAWKKYVNLYGDSKLILILGISFLFLPIIQVVFMHQKDAYAGIVFIVISLALFYYRNYYNVQYKHTDKSYLIDTEEANITFDNKIYPIKKRFDFESCILLVFNRSFITLDSSKLSSEEKKQILDMGE